MTIVNIGDFVGFVFPSAIRANANANNLDSRKMSEANLTRMISLLTDNKNFVINDDNTDIEFCLDGYYFKCTKGYANTKAGGYPVYVTKTTTPGQSEISSVTFSTTSTEGSLCLLEQDANNNVSVPISSYYRYVLNSSQKKGINYSQVFTDIVEIDGNKD